MNEGLGSNPHIGQVNGGNNNMRGLLKIGFGLFLAGILLAGTAVHAQTLEKSFAHSLPIGQQAASFEHRIDLPADWAARGEVFVGRSLALVGKLVIEREELKPTYYYVKVRLPKATVWFAKGEIKISLKGGTTPSLQTPGAPQALKAIGGTRPLFSWLGEAPYANISLMDRGDGATLWERVLLGSNKAELDEGEVRVGRRYLWAVRLAGENARYSAESQMAFRVGTKAQSCRDCRGTGYETCRQCNGSGHIVVMGPNNQPQYKVCGTCVGTGRVRCVWCNGTGTVHVAVVIPE
jgi:hypothetical protein